MKKLLYLFLVFGLFACSSDPNNENLNLQIGDFHQGGMIFSLNASGYSGKVASIEDLGTMSRLQGVNACEDFVFEGYYDWYLPDIGELSLMFNTIGQGEDNIGDFTDARYWSSSTNSSGSFLSFNFGTGESENGWNPILNFRIRAVRSFP